MAAEVEVRFTAEGPERTQVELERRDLDRFGATREQVRAAFEFDGGWRGLLAAFAQAAAAQAAAGCRTAGSSLSVTSHCGRQ
jgi:hypothetical protein